ncbi:hemerythrin domain-containing protein [Mediterraneibacter sp. NSJ-55]|uniref:Hemerythrin domain-containing protein n=1 Tax=Mediterraneibacter hominis TaxID=2763054 RepID=A0A923LK09_9FIRM|nr:hemerythrin domain-containing protein [Mediterraneibacter hominis]MBC5689376.1 hemerythrin domain-containing protein [Mediterraneibacter hominis]
MRYEITPDLLTGNHLIDSEHKQLFEAVNRLLESFSNKSEMGKNAMTTAAAFLESYVDKHFGHEEELQKKYQWREYDTHHRFHEEYKKILREIIRQIPESGPEIEDMSRLNVHVVRLITHIRTMDKRLGTFIQTQEENK